MGIEREVNSSLYEFELGCMLSSGMDFQLVTSTLLRDFEKEEVHYAIIGGFALGLWGASRATIDIDFLLLIDDLPKAETILSQFAYRRVYQSENVVQYVSDLAPYGQVDVLLAFREISRRMLERGVSKEIDNGLSINTLIPEDLIGLKLQASVNDPSRASKESVDIESLLEAKQRSSQSIGWELLEDYYLLFDKQNEFEQLKEKYGSA